MAKDKSLDIPFPGEEPALQRGNNHLLLIGIDTYADTRINNLNNAKADAEALGAILLEKYQFNGELVTLYDQEATRAGIYGKLDYFTDNLQEDDSLLIFFSGHGYYRANQKRGYLVPADAKYSQFHSLISNTVLIEDYLPNLPARHVVLILDSCFSGSLFKNVDFTGTQPATEAVRKMMASRSRLGMAAGSIELVSDGLVGNHSPFAHSLIHHLRSNQQPHLPILDLFHPVSQMTTYSADQRPVYGVLAKNRHVPGAQLVLSLKRKQQSADQAAWQQACNQDSIAAYQAYRRKNRQGAYRAEALQRIKALEEERDWQKALRRNSVSSYEEFLDHYPNSLKNEEVERRIDALLSGEPIATPTPKQTPPPKVKQPPKPRFDFPVPELIRIEGGTFRMGSNEGERERPIHEVTIHSFELGKYPVTQRQWQAIMGENPSHFKGDDRPVERVSWDDCQKFIQKLNQKTSLKFRLPTEAEWEYAAGGGASNRTKWSGTDSEAELDKYAWYSKNSDKRTHPVGQKQPNPLGLYDLSSNVWEWCQDWYGAYPSEPQTNPTGPSTGGPRVLRGGSWYGDARGCRVAFRLNDTPDRRNDSYGFRLARTP